jgi:hypothetical protein
VAQAAEVTVQARGKLTYSGGGWTFAVGTELVVVEDMLSVQQTASCRPANAVEVSFRR